MPFYKRGFLYLARKRAKSVLLLLIFLFVNSMILSTNMILHATERTEAAMQEKAGAKVVCEIMNTTHPITDTEAETIKNLEAVTSINRMGQQAAYLTDLVSVPSYPINSFSTAVNSVYRSPRISRSTFALAVMPFR